MVLVWSKRVILFRYTPVYTSNLCELRLLPGIRWHFFELHGAVTVRAAALNQEEVSQSEQKYFCVLGMYIDAVGMTCLIN
jgi:hypothetical protein